MAVIISIEGLLPESRKRGLLVWAHANEARTKCT